MFFFFLFKLNIFNFFLKLRDPNHFKSDELKKDAGIFMLKKTQKIDFFQTYKKKKRLNFLLTNEKGENWLMRVNNIIKLTENIHSYYQTERRNMSIVVDLGKPSF